MGSPGGEEVGRLSVRVLPDTSSFGDDLRAELRKLESTEQVKIPVVFDVDTAGLRTTLEAMPVPTVHVPVEFDTPVNPTVPVGADTTQATKDVDEFIVKTQAKKPKLTVQAEIDKANVERILSTLSAKAKLDVDQAHLLASFRAAIAASHAVGGTKVEVDVDKDRLMGTLATLGAEIARVLGGFLSSAAGGLATFFSNLGGSISDLAKSIGGELASSLGNVRTLLLEVVKNIVLMSAYGAAFALVGAAVSEAWGAVATAIAAIPAAVALIAVPAAAVMLGMDGIKKAAAKIKPEFDKLKAAVSGTFEKGLTPVLKELATIFPVLQPLIQSTASALVGLAKGLTDFIVKGPGLALIKTLFENVNTALAKINLVPLIDGFLRLAGTKSALDLIVNTINTIGTSFDSMVKQVQGNTLDAAFAGLQGVLGSVTQGFMDLVENGIKLFSTAAPGLKSTIDAITGFFNKFDWAALGKSVGGVFQGIADAINKIPPATVTAIQQGFQKLGETFQSPGFSSALANIAQLLPEVLDDISGFVTFVSGTVNVLKTVVDFFSSLDDAMSNGSSTGIWWLDASLPQLASALWEGVKTAVSTAWQWIKDNAAAVWDSITTTISTAWTNIKTAVSTGISNALTAVGTWITGLPAAIGQGITAALVFLGTWAIELPAKILAGIAAALATFGIWYTGLQANILKGITTALAALGGWVVGLPAKILEGINAALAAFGTWVSGLASKVLEGINAGLAALGGWVSGLPAKILEGINAALAGLGAWVTGLPAKVGEGITAALTAAGVWGADFPAKIGAALSGALAQVGTWAGQFKDAVIGGLGGVISGLISTIGGWISSIGGLFKTAWTTISDGVGAAFSAVGDAIGTALDAIKGVISGWLDTGVKQPIATGLGQVPTVAQGPFDSLKQIITTALDTVKTTISGWASSIGGFFTTAWTNVSTGASTALGLLNTAISTALTLVNTTVSTWSTGISTLFATAWTTITTGVTTAFTTITTAISTALTTLTTTITTWTTSVGALFTTAWTTISSGVTTAFATIGTAITTALATLTTTISTWTVTTVPLLFSTMWTTLQTGVAAAWALLNTAVVTGTALITTTITTWQTALTLLFTTLWTTLNTNTALAFTTLNTAVVTGTGLITTTITTWSTTTLPGLFNTLWTAATTATTTGWTNINNAVTAGTAKVVTTIQTMITTIQNNLNTLVSNMTTIGNNMMTALANAIIAGQSKVVNAIAQVIAAAISAAVGALQINSPSKVFQGIGSSIPEGSAKGVDDNAHLLVNSVTDMAKAAIDAGNKGLAVGLNDGAWSAAMSTNIAKSSAALPAGMSGGVPNVVVKIGDQVLRDIVGVEIGGRDQRLVAALAAR